VGKQVVRARRAEPVDKPAPAHVLAPAGAGVHGQLLLDAGRGVGMDVVARSISALGGKIGVSTNPGKFTRFKIVLPATVQADSAVA